MPNLHTLTISLCTAVAVAALAALPCRPLPSLRSLSITSLQVDKALKVLPPAQLDLSVRCRERLQIHWLHTEGVAGCLGVLPVGGPLREWEVGFMHEGAEEPWDEVTVGRMLREARWRVEASRLRR